MSDFMSVREALAYIDAHLDEPISFERLAERFHFSAFYFHRMFSLIVGKPIACHIRDRRLMQARLQLSRTDEPILRIALACGFQSAQSFARSFRNACGLSPSEYRRQGLIPDVVTVDDMVKKFTNRLKGGVYVNPKIIRRNGLVIAGVSGPGNKTGETWQELMKLNEEKPLPNKLSENGYEVRLYEDGASTVHVGFAVADEAVEPPYTAFALPASKYASFDVYVANGYDSENNAMDEWLLTNPDGYAERLLGDAHYCVEYYDERFNGNEAGSIVEIWVPIEKKKG